MTKNYPIQHTEQFEALFNYATIGILITDLDGKIVTLNRHAEIQFGYHSAEILGKTIELPTKFHSAHTTHRASFYRICNPAVWVREENCLLYERMALNSP